MHNFITFGIRISWSSLSNSFYELMKFFLTNSVFILCLSSYIEQKQWTLFSETKLLQSYCFFILLLIHLEVWKYILSQIWKHDQIGLSFPWFNKNKKYLMRYHGNFKKMLITIFWNYEPFLLVEFNCFKVTKPI